ncbi:MAG: anaerobic ribonucleoside-triphosphate reductase activating protein [Akkermansiaceae bacterium]|nr:anaerobic ribonucleoside-triphosphate reductase activating protein [Akkermansiaceae bacterium]
MPVNIEKLSMRGPADITPLTCLDYPGKAACIFWFRGCNLRCPYCYNPEFVTTGGAEERLDWMRFLDERRGFLDAVVMSGGEATLHRDLLPVCRAVKQMGYLVKIDTNGSSPLVLEALIAEGLVDYVAVDHKMPAVRTFHLQNGVSLFDRFCETVGVLRTARVPFEVRTTCHPSLLDEQDIVNMIHEAAELGYTGTYFLQYYFDAGETLGHMKKPVRRYDRLWIDSRSALPLGYRNFPEDRYSFKANPIAVSA